MRTQAPHTREGRMRTPLSDIEIQRELGSLQGWTRRGGALVKTFTFPTFAEGIAFVGRVARLADAMDHHPDMDIRYTKITCALSTHEPKGITQLDIRLAEKIEKAVEG